jgi:hypothetical protein
MLIYGTNVSYFFSLAAIEKTIMFLAVLSKQTNVKKIPVSITMAICLPLNIFAKSWPNVWLEQSSDII